MHDEFFRIIFQKKEYVEAHCIDRNNPLHFACRRWISYNQSP